MLHRERGSPSPRASPADERRNLCPLPSQLYSQATIFCDREARAPPRPRFLVDRCLAPRRSASSASLRRTSGCAKDPGTAPRRRRSRNSSARAASSRPRPTPTPTPTAGATCNPKRVTRGGASRFGARPRGARRGAPSPYAQPPSRAQGLRELLAMLSPGRRRAPARPDGGVLRPFERPTRRPQAPPMATTSTGTRPGKAPPGTSGGRREKRSTKAASRPPTAATIAASVSATRARPRRDSRHTAGVKVTTYCCANPEGYNYLVDQPCNGAPPDSSRGLRARRQPRPRRRRECRARSVRRRAHVRRRLRPRLIGTVSVPYLSIHEKNDVRGIGVASMYICPWMYTCAQVPRDYHASVSMPRRARRAA